MKSSRKASHTDAQAVINHLGPTAEAARGRRDTALALALRGGS